MILGREFLKAYEVVIDHGTDEIVIKKTLNLQKFTDPVCYSVETKVLEPNTENFVTCHSNVISGGRNVLLTPDINTDGVYWANCLSTVDHAGDFIVKVLNLNDSKVELTNGMPVGAITESYTLLEDSRTIELKTITVDKSNGININEKPNRDRISKLKFGKKLTAEQRKRLVVVKKSKMDAFQWEETDIGLTDLVEHEIITGSNKPIKLKQYKIPQAVQILDEQIEELVKNDLIEPTISPWCSPMMIAKQVKRDGSIKHRFITDMTSLTSLIEPLVTMNKLKEPMGRIGNLLLKLQDFDYDRYYQPGALNFIPDLLSRPSVDVVTEVNNTEIQFDSCVNWKAEQNVDDQCVQIIKILNSNSEGTMNDIQTWQELAKPAEWFKVRTNLLLENGILLFNHWNTRKIVVPKQVTT
jgi:hypothetical protein